MAKTSGRGGPRSGAGRPSAWQHQPTQSIRVPQIFAEALIEIAKQLDRGFDEPIIIDPKSLKISLQAKQEVLTWSQLRIYKSSGHKVLRLEELVKFLQDHLD